MAASAAWDYAEDFAYFVAEDYGVQMGYYFAVGGTPQRL